MRILKITASVFFALTMLVLTGCTRMDEYLAEQIEERASITAEDTYKEYESNVEAGNVDENGYYKDDPEENESSVISNKNVVSFSKNNKLDIKYYYDSDYRQPIPENTCELDLGNPVFAIVDVSDEVASIMYYFAEFQIYQSDERKEKGKLINTVSADDKNEGKYKITFPENQRGSFFTVEPVGKYQNKVVHLSDYYVDESGEKQPVSGTWMLNNEICTSKTFEVSPVKPYIVSYEFNSNEYFFKDSKPESYYNDSDDGQVIFKQMEAGSTATDYSVELRRYVDVTLVSDEDRKVKVNNGDEQTISANSELRIQHLKYGDEVLIESNKRWAQLNNCKDLLIQSEEYLSEGSFSTKRNDPKGSYLYKMIVPEQGGEFVFDPKKYENIEHGTIKFTCFGKRVDTIQKLARGSRIYYEKDTADNGYWLPETDKYIEVQDSQSTIKNLKAIHFTSKIPVKVALPQPEFGGSIVYSRIDENGNEVEISSDTIREAFSGDTIHMVFKNWEGWNSNYGDSGNYSVTKEEDQVATLDGKDLTQAFKEDQDHKPELTLTLEKTVGTNMTFILDGSGCPADPVKYDGEISIETLTSGKLQNYNLDQSEEVVPHTKIGTERPIVIKMENRAIASTKAMRIKTVYTDVDGKKITSLQYVPEGSVKIGTVAIYPENKPNSVWYKAIDITIGLVDIVKMPVSPVIDHAKSYIVREADNSLLKEGDLLEEDARVVVSIVPDEGYYVDGKKTSAGKYSESMKYSDYVKNLNTIITEHPIKQYCKVTLGTSDRFAKYNYQLEKQAVSGTIVVREGQKVTLEYEIIDGTHRIDVDRSTLFGNLKSTTKAEKELIITKEYNGKTIDRADFGINVVEGN